MRKGDIARALFYAAIRYEGGTHGSLGIAEPDLILTDNLGLIAASNTGSNESAAYMGRLATLLVWHLDDPVDEFERRRNGVVASFQGNRNPFVDHPEWVACAFTGDCDPGFAYCSPNVTNLLRRPRLPDGRGQRLDRRERLQAAPRWPSGAAVRLRRLQSPDRHRLQPRRGAGQPLPQR